MGCRAGKMRGGPPTPPPPIFATNINKREQNQKLPDNLFPAQIFERSAVFGLSMKAKRKGCGGQMDMKKHRKHELGKT